MAHKKTLITLTLILTLPLSLCPFGISSFNDLPKKPTDTSFKKPITRQRKAPKTAQEREEQSMLQTLDELAAIAEGLSKFTQSKETDEAAKAKAKIQETKEKESAARLKQQQSRGSSWRPSSGSYTPSRSGYSGGSGYGGGYGGRSYGGGGYGGGSSPWSSSRSSSPWGSSSSGLSSSRSGGGGGSSSGFDYDDGDETGKKKKDKSDKKHRSSGAVITDSGKGVEEAYTKLIHSTKQGADLIEKALKVIDTKTGTAAAKALLENNQFTQLNKLAAILAEIEKADSKLQPDEKKKLENKKGNLLKQQQDRLNGAIKKIAHDSLIAATLHEDEKMVVALVKEQNKAKAFLELPEVQSHLTNKEINDRGSKLLGFWEKKHLTALTTKRKQLAIEQKNQGATKAASLLKQTLANDFNTIRTSIDDIGQKFPKLPEPIGKMLEKIDEDIKKIADLT